MMVSLTTGHAKCGCSMLNVDTTLPAGGPFIGEFFLFFLTFKNLINVQQTDRKSHRRFFVGIVDDHIGNLKRFLVIYAFFYVEYYGDKFVYFFII